MRLAGFGPTGSELEKLLKCCDMNRLARARSVLSEALKSVG